MTIKLILMLGLLCVAADLFAQDGTGCPNGETATGPRSPANPLGCVPNPQAQNGQPAQPRGRWEIRWGAIAIDETKNTLGAVVGMRSKSKATKAAVEKCRANNGSLACKKTLYSYYNQCAAVAWGDTGYIRASGPNLNEVSQRAMLSCSKTVSNCKVVYAECSDAVWVQ
jgi:hypothetical protein